MKILTMILLCVTFIFAAVDINTAEKKELITLSGIGAKKADAIISYRQDNCFKIIDELSKVKGIGKKTVEKNRDNLTVSECKVK
ncbi:MAG: helix-hairpin-helix domain-containing protein [Sulfurimonas sp.]|nr:helix-hairpin-helix domain-containing protein [Sulfurimonas sp.]